MKVLVVGGTGLIGGEIALYLQKNGHDVTLMSRKPTTAAALARGGADDVSPAARLSAGSAGSVNQAPAEAAPTIRTTRPARATGRFANGGTAAITLDQLSLPIILQPYPRSGVAEKAWRDGRQRSGWSAG